jgi:hypothetical protein
MSKVCAFLVGTLASIKVYESEFTIESWEMIILADKDKEFRGIIVIGIIVSV